MASKENELVWTKVLDADELPEGRVKPVTCLHRTLCMTRHEGRYGALDNHCPHQGGPLGEGSIENGLLRCPWHGWDYDPITGKAPGYDDGVQTFEVDVRDGGVWVGMAKEREHVRTVGDLMMETLANWGVEQVFGMVGHSNLGVADALRIQEDDPRFKGRKVISVSGDGGFGQYLAELTTAVKYNMDITHILLNNNELGKISKEQKAGDWDVWQTSLRNPDFAEYANLCGALGLSVRTKGELDGAISKALEHKGPSLVEIHSDVELV